MVTSIIDASLRHRFLIIIATVMIVAAGVWSMKNTPLDAIPDLSDRKSVV